MSTFPTYQVGETPWIRTRELTRTKEETAVTTLQPGESIAYVIAPVNSQGTVGTLVGSGDSSSAVTHWANGTWAAIARKTGGTPLDAGKYRIRWTLTVGGGVSVEDDYLTIRA